jgi:hypothetical protein
LVPDVGNLGVCLLRPFLPFDGSLLGLSEGLPDCGHSTIEVGKFGFLILEATLEVIILSFQGPCAIVVIPEMSQLFVVSLVNLAREELYLFSGTVHLFPVILSGKEAVALFSDSRSGLLSSSLVTSSNGDMKL